jgi:hypothetical protein
MSVNGLHTFQVGREDGCTVNYSAGLKRTQFAVSRLVDGYGRYMTVNTW